MIIGIAGGTGSGKTTFVNKLLEQISDKNITLISQDAYYHDSLHLSVGERKNKNFDHPDAIDWSLLVQQLNTLSNGNSVAQPIYSMITCSREADTLEIFPSKIILVEGILIFSQPQLRELMQLKVFIDADADQRLIRVVKRDMELRGRNVEEVMHRYVQTVRPMHEKFIEPSKKYADVIVPIGGNNQVAIKLISQYIESQL